MYRNKSFDEKLSAELKNPRFVREYLTSLMEGDEGLSVEDALRITIQQMGVREFCSLADVQISNVVSFLRRRRHPKPETLDSYLRPFGLKTKLTLAKAS